MLDTLKLVAQVPDEADQSACCLLLAASEQAATFGARMWLEDAVSHLLARHGFQAESFADRLERVLLAAHRC